MNDSDGFVDIHCHLLPGIDDGSKSWDQSLAMARIAVGDGIRTVTVTPHQLGNFAHNHGDDIRTRTIELQKMLDQHGVPLDVLPGADVRIEAGMIAKLRSGEVLTLADRGKHVLLELPHEMYFPLEEVLDDLHRVGMVGILSHPERNQGLLKQPKLIEPLIEYGCLMQVTSGSLMGTFGPGPQQMATWMIEQGFVHFLATDAHGPSSRRPLIRRAFERAAELAGEQIAEEICCRNPAAVVDGGDVAAVIHRPKTVGFLANWFRRRKAA